jgi:DNA-binding transcriptional LysR family regulator
LLRTEQLRPAAAASLNPDPISWQAWMLAAGIKGQVVNGPYFGSTNLALEAAIAGRGLTLSPAILAQDDIQAKRLVIPFAVSLPDPFSYWLLCRGDRIEEVRIRAFTKWIMQEAEASANALANQTS